MQNNDLYLTAQGAEKLKQELEVLITQERTKISKRLKSAIEQGDLTENADYISAKEEQAFLEGRIQELEFLLKNAIIIENMEKDISTVGIGDMVTIQEKGFPEEKYYMVGSKEANPSNGLISHLSPLGKAIIGCKAGDQVKVNTPDGPLIITIIKIE